MLLGEATGTESEQTHRSELLSENDERQNAFHSGSAIFPHSLLEVPLPA